MSCRRIVYEVDTFLIIYVSFCGSSDVGMRGRAKQVTARNQPWERQICTLRRNIAFTSVGTQYLSIS
jgi:hypothetical protein